MILVYVLPAGVAGSFVRQLIDGRQERAVAYIIVSQDREVAGSRGIAGVAISVYKLLELRWDYWDTITFWQLACRFVRTARKAFGQG